MEPPEPEKTMNDLNDSLEYREDLAKPDDGNEDELDHKPMAIANNSQMASSSIRQSQEASFQNHNSMFYYRFGYYIPVIKQVLEYNGIAQVSGNCRPNIIWNPKMHNTDLFAKLGPQQKINHFPNSAQLGRKDCLNKNIFNMQVKFPREFNFLPRSYILPQEEPVLLDVGLCS